MALSPSPAPMPMSKRDKRRQNVQERLSDMATAFGKDQPAHYRAQLQAIQVDMTLCVRADPYEASPLDDSAEAIQQQIENIASSNLPAGSAAQQDYVALAGRRYHDYVQKINEAMEQRDADLTALKNRYDSANAELERTTNYKVQVAQREHAELATTIRQRLINSVTKKRERLLREKEQLDIADSNSMFLHPSQFSMNIPGSPGGIQRKTRNARYKIGEAEEAVAERGRKRKALAEDEGNESPAPAFRTMVNDAAGASSPYHEARAKTLYAQYEAPAYSIERLFTDKELAQASNVAQFATHNFFHQQQQQLQDSANGALANGQGTGVPSLDGSADTTVMAATVTTADGEDQPTHAPANGTPPASQAGAVDMERTVSHATRGATKANPLNFLSEAAAAVSTTSSINPFIPQMVPITKTDKGAPAPPGVNVMDVDSDLALMMREDEGTNDDRYADVMDHDGPKDDNNNISAVRARFLEQACRDPIATQPFRLPLMDTGPAAILGGVNRPVHFGYADPASIPNGSRDGNAAPVATGPAAGLGSLAAALQGAVGGLPMSRTTSLGGSDMGVPSEAGGGVGMRRVRNRLI